jgi:hypothetical protein
MINKILILLGLKRRYPSFQVTDWQKVRALWDVVPREARWQLIEWFVFNPNELGRRYAEEMKFKSNLHRMRRS